MEPHRMAPRFGATRGSWKWGKSGSCFRYFCAGSGVGGHHEKGPSTPRRDVTAARRRRGRTGGAGCPVGGSGLLAALSPLRPLRPAIPGGRSEAPRSLTAGIEGWRRSELWGVGAPRRRARAGQASAPRAEGSGAARWGRWAAAPSLRLPRPLCPVPFPFPRREKSRERSSGGRGSPPAAAACLCLLRRAQHCSGVSAKFPGAKKIPGCLSCLASYFLIFFFCMLKDSQ